MNATSISAEDHQANKVSKAKQPQVVDRFKELIDHLAQQHKYEHINKMGMRGNYMATKIYTNMPNMVQPLSYTMWKMMNQ